MSIQLRIIEIIRRIKGEISIFYTINPDETLTSSHIQMSEIEMVYLFLELQKMFEIDLKKINYNFESISTVNAISEQIESLVVENVKVL